MPIERPVDLVQRELGRLTSAALIRSFLYVAMIV